MLANKPTLRWTENIIGNELPKYCVVPCKNSEGKDISFLSTDELLSEYSDMLAFDWKHSAHMRLQAASKKGTELIQVQGLAQNIHGSQRELETKAQVEKN